MSHCIKSQPAARMQCALCFDAYLSQMASQIMCLVQGLAEQLMTIDTPASLQEGTSGPLRLSALGCAILSHALRLPQVPEAGTCMQSLQEALLALPATQIACKPRACKEATTAYILDHLAPLSPWPTMLVSLIALSCLVC